VTKRNVAKPLLLLLGTSVLVISVGGFAELAANVATGTSTSFSSNRYISAVTGNAISALAFGDTGDAGLVTGLVRTILTTRSGVA
jgi:hypothetical protein